MRRVGIESGSRGPLVQPLTTASHPFLASPPAALSDYGFLKDRSALTLGRDEDAAALAAFRAKFSGSAVMMEDAGRAELDAIIPGLLPQWTHGIVEPSCADIDVGSLHAAYLRYARQRGVELKTRTRVEALARTADGDWLLTTTGDELTAGLIVNAAGAWADEVAALAAVAPVGITPFRRTLLQLRIGTATPAELPLVIDVSGDFYFKGEAEGKVWLSPHDEIPDEPSDAAPEELDVAIAIDRLQHVVDWPILAVERKWAGLRSFAPDRLPVIGADPLVPDFFWLAGQGGFGIMTAPALAALAGGAIMGDDPDSLHAGLTGLPDVAAFSPDRFDL